MFNKFKGKVLLHLSIFFQRRGLLLHDDETNSSFPLPPHVWQSSVYVGVCRCPSMSIGVRHFPLVSVGDRQCMLVSVGVCRCPSVFIVVRRCLSVSVGVRKCQCLSLGVCLNLLRSTHFVGKLLFFLFNFKMWWISTTVYPRLFSFRVLTISFMQRS